MYRTKEFLDLLKICVISLLLQSCTVQYAYNNLDRFILWGVSDYIQMTTSQRALFDAEFEGLHRWHRETQLPKYAKILRELPPALLDGTSSEELLALEEKTFVLIETTFERVLPLSSQILLMMNEQQMAKLPIFLERANRNIIGKEGSEDLARVQSIWASELSSYARRFVGRLSRSQRSYIKTRSADYIPERILWFEYRKRWQQDFMTLLFKKPNKIYFEEQFSDLVKNRERYYGAPLTDIFAHNENLSREIAVWLINNLSESQRKYLEERLLGLSKDFQDLSNYNAR
ncbi:MAG: hypothetical protein CMD74_03160 [Gammaproteobacteria bacterium]|nr:hypothetical protein [Gammaproteobacteria bacterium]